MALREVHSDLAQRGQTHLAVHGLAYRFLAHHMPHVVDGPHHREIDRVMRHVHAHETGLVLVSRFLPGLRRTLGQSHR